MKKLHKLAATVAMVLSLGGVAHQASASQALGPFPDRGGMVLENGGRGDALLFPVFYGYGENYFTISNSSGEWVQGHLRFRGAAWSGELLDFDVILSPGDVFVFRLADIDGDGYWEIDESLDLRNFQYTGMNMNCQPEGGVGVSRNNCIDQNSLLVPEPTNKDTGVWAGGNITPELIEHNRHMGYVEFIGEGVFQPRTLMTSSMSRFIDSANAGKLAGDGQRQTGNKLGTSLWSWVNGYDAYPVNDTGAPVMAADAANNKGLNPFYTTSANIGACVDPKIGNALDTGGLGDSCLRRSARGVPNVLSGTAFISQVGQNHGVAYNAESLFDFRTNTSSTNDGSRGCVGKTVAVGTDCGSRPVAHRVDNYPTDNAVILHHENPRAAAAYFYVYAYAPVPNENLFESRISFNNTWGPTLADGNDYTLVQDIAPANLAFVSNPYRWVDFTNTATDTWDNEFADTGTPNSIAEVEEAIRKGYPSATALNAKSGIVDGNGNGGYTPDVASSRQRFTGYYSDNNAMFGKGLLSSWYFAFFPTKYFYGEHPTYWFNGSSGPGRNALGQPNGSEDDRKLLGKHGYLEAAVTNMLNWAKPFNVEVWDIFENTPVPKEEECLHSPCVVPQGPSRVIALREELAYFNIKNLKNLFEGADHQAWTGGRVVLTVPPASNMCAFRIPGLCLDTYPGLLYTFDIDGTTGYLANWRPLER